VLTIRPEAELLVGSGWRYVSAGQQFAIHCIIRAVCCRNPRFLCVMFVIL